MLVVLLLCSLISLWKAVLATDFDMGEMECDCLVMHSCANFMRINSFAAQISIGFICL